VLHARHNGSAAADDTFIASVKAAVIDVYSSLPLW